MFWHGAEAPSLNTLEHSVLFSKAALRRNYLTWVSPVWGNGNPQLQPPLTTLSPWKQGNWESFMKFTATGTLNTVYGHPPPAHQHTTTGECTRFLYTLYVTSTFQQKITIWRDQTHVRTKARYGSVLALSDWKFILTMINMLRALLVQVDNMQAQMCNISRQMEILKKNQKKISGIKTLTEMKNAFVGLISRHSWGNKLYASG